MTGLAGCRAAAQYSRARDGRAVVIARHGSVLHEDYSNGGAPNQAFRLASGTKSFWGGAFAAGVDDGLFTEVSRVAEVLTEWADHPQGSRVIVRQLLDFTSGLSLGIDRLRQGRRADMFAAALDIPFDGAPGAQFLYAPSHLTVFGAYLKRRLGGESPLAYLRRRVFRPIGLRVGDWRTDRAGNPGMSAGAVLRAREWLKYGQLIAAGGAWAGGQVLSPAVLRSCLVGSCANPMFGLTFWLNSAPDPGAGGAADHPITALDPISGRIAPGAPPDLVMAVGAGHQRLYVIPSSGLVVVRFGHRDPTWRDAEFLDALLG